MLGLICVGLVLALGITVLVLELRAGTRVTDEPRREIVIALALLGLLSMVAFSPWLTWLWNHALPVERPEEPWRRDGVGCSGDSGGPPWIILAAMYLVVRAGPAPWLAMATGLRARSSTKLPTGHLALRIAIAAFAITGAIASVRLIIGGAPVSQFTTYGATTPAGAGGWRADLYLATLGSRSPIEHGEMLDDEFEHHEGSDCCGALAGPAFDSAHEGLMAWVDDQPVVIYRAGTRVLGAYVRDRDDAMVPHERRPHFAGWPALARFDDDTLLLVGKAMDGSLLVVKVSDDYLTAEPADDGDAWIFVSPPKLPFLVAILFGVAGFALARTGREHRWARLLAAWALLEGATIFLYGYARYVV